MSSDHIRIVIDDDGIHVDGVLKIAWSVPIYVFGDIRASIESSKDVKILGNVYGDIKASKVEVVGDVTGSIKGQLMCGDIKGPITCEAQRVTIQGSVYGDCTTKNAGELTIQGSVSGDVSATRNCSIQGSVQGDVVAGRNCSIQGNVVGDISAGNLIRG